jgi:hypothetical protein
MGVRRSFPATLKSKIASPSAHSGQPDAPARRIRPRRFHLRTEDGRIPRTRSRRPGRNVPTYALLWPVGAEGQLSAGLSMLLLPINLTFQYQFAVAKPQLKLGEEFGSPSEKICWIGQGSGQADEAAIQRAGRVQKIRDAWSPAERDRAELIAKCVRPVCVLRVATTRLRAVPGELQNGRENPGSAPLRAGPHRLWRFRLQLKQCNPLM